MEMQIEYPIPVVRDRQGRLVKDSTLKDWFAKLNEELDELKDVCLGAYLLDDTPGRIPPISLEHAALIAGEACDLIKTVCSMVNQMGIDREYLDETMRDCNEKTRRRGCHE